MISRRGVFSALALLVPSGGASAQSVGGARRPLRFTVWRNGSQIGRHDVVFTGHDAEVEAAIDAEMLVKLGPIPVFRYRHEARETWREGRFAVLKSRTTSNGRVEEVAASRSAQGVLIARGQHEPPWTAPADAHPLTHWNRAALDGALFNPQTGALLHERVSRSFESFRLDSGTVMRAGRYALVGDAEITDWYDESGDWVALRAKAPDGSIVDYRRES